MKDFLRRFANIPDMLELDHLTVSGDVTFGKNVILKVGFLSFRLLLSDNNLLVVSLRDKMY